jgi:hypothetical protein
MESRGSLPPILVTGNRDGAEHAACASSRVPFLLLVSLGRPLSLLCCRGGLCQRAGHELRAA